MSVSFPYIFGPLSGAIPLTDLDANFAAINTAIGTSAGNLVALNASAQLPAVDGSLLFGLSSTSFSIPVRQTVLAGATTSGAASFLSAGTGLAVSLAATATPIVLTTANGFGVVGAVDTVTRIVADLANAWSGLTASQAFVGLYIDTTAPAVPTYGFSLLVPSYSQTAPAGPATDQHWFDLTAYQMNRWSGAAWVGVQRVFVGEAVTGASSVTSVITYALQREYYSGWTATLPSSAGTTSRNSNLGVEPIYAAVQVKCLTAEYGFAVGDIVTWVFGGGYYGAFIAPGGGASRNTVFCTIGGATAWAILNKSTGAGTYCTPANWAYQLIATGF